jgi:aquaporin Z
MKPLRIAGAEAVGTAVLMIGGPGSAILAGDRIGLLGISLAFGLSLLIMAYAIGPVSGCHINPAVTLAMVLARKTKASLLAFYWGGQLIGAALGGLIIFSVARGLKGWEKGAFASNGWGKLSPSGYGLGAALVVEVVLTALLVFVVLMTTTKGFAPGMGGLVAGLTYTLIHLISIPIDNTSVNPARSFGAAIFGGTEPLKQLWAFLVFPLLGAIVGTLVWIGVDDTTLEDTEFGRLND